MAVLKAKYCCGDRFKGLTIRGNGVNIKLVGDNLTVDNLLNYLDCFGVIELEKIKNDKKNKQIMIVTRNGERLFGNVYEADPDSPRPFPDYSKSTMQDYRELDKFKEELKIEEIAVERWAVVEVE